MNKLLLIPTIILATAAYGGASEDSARFLGMPYMESPLGEGAGAETDDDPLWRFDAFDCVTFVETALALSIADGQEGFEKAMNAIRYKDGEISFLARNHFMNPDWIENNARLVRDATAGIAKAAGVEALTRRTVIDRKSWFRKAHGIEADFEPQEVSLAYISIADILAAKEKFARAIDAPMIANIVVEDAGAAAKYGTDNDIAHTGFLIPAGKALIFRHASSRAGKVADADFFDYIKSLRKHKKHIGVNVLEIKR
jgi:hypothetical protein